MCAQIQDEKPNFLLSILKCKCTRCRRGDMFQTKNPYARGFMKMNERCPVCGQPLDLEPGFYYGTNMVSYALAVLICVFTFFTWWLTIGFSLQDNRFFLVDRRECVFTDCVTTAIDAYFENGMVVVLCAVYPQLEGR